jgi:cytochrome c peroxidase
VSGRRTFVNAVLAGAAATACADTPAPTVDRYPWELPPGLPPPLVPADNPMTVEKVALGRRLFFDERLSVNGTTSCATCHAPGRAFTDAKPTPTGATGDAVPRNALTLTNVAYRSVYTWANPVLTSLEEQALVPLTADVPLELGLQKATGAIVERLRADAEYPALFAAAFPDDADPYRAETIAKAIASFERTLLSKDAPYDRYVYGGDEASMSASARRGLDLFNSERLECYHCHAGPDFTNATATATSPPAGRPHFFNNGLYNVGGTGAYPPDAPGLRAFTTEARDDGKFRVPTLRNIAVTGPYMHDGSVATLSEVVDLYAAGGRNVTEGPYAGDGRSHPVKSAFIRGFTLTPGEKEDLLAFLASLTDETFLNEPRFRSPFGTKSK